jgi:hypothetical protein
VVSQKEVTEAWPLLARTSALKAELIALTRALTLGKEKRFNIYTDSKYAFLVHICTVRETIPIKHGKEILQLLEAIHLPKVAVIHCWEIRNS